MRRGTGESASVPRPQQQQKEKGVSVSVQKEKTMQFVNNSRTRPMSRPRSKAASGSPFVNILRWKVFKLMFLMCLIFGVFYVMFVLTGPTSTKDIHGINRYFPEEPISFVHGDHMDVIHIEHRAGYVNGQQVPVVQPVQRQDQGLANPRPVHDQQVVQKPVLVNHQPNVGQEPVAVPAIPLDANSQFNNVQFNVAGGENVPNLAPDNTGLGEFPFHIIQSLTNTNQRPYLKTRFQECMISMLDKASINLHFFFVVDKPSKVAIMEIMQDITNRKIARSKFQFNFLDIDDLAKELAPMVTMLQEHVSGGHPYYGDAIFFLSIAIHQHLMPQYVHHLIMLDTDLIFKTDIKELFNRFNLFTQENIIGVAHEQQPVYRHMLSLYRSHNRGTKVGGPPPDGLTGFNSGVLLLDLDHMRKSELYHSYLDSTNVKVLTQKYTFKGHLGDQDFFTLLSFDHPELFHVLPCSWNRQLCVWWRDKGYADVFDQYFNCAEKINIYHGNCNTPIPKLP